MSHSIDFHASQTAMNDQMVEIKPGATFTYTFTADYAGVWMYHCGTAPALHHIANGMYGMVIVEPKGGLPKVDQEVALVQSEWYLGAQKAAGSTTPRPRPAAPAPDFVVFNGVANQYKDNPIQVTTKGRVRVFVLDAGPNIDSSFHVVGTIFDTVIKEGITLARGNAGGWGSQAVDLSPGAGRDHRVQPAGGRDVPDRDPRLQLRGSRRDRDLHGRRRRPEELIHPPAPDPWTNGGALAGPRSFVPGGPSTAWPMALSGDRPRMFHERGGLSARWRELPMRRLFGVAAATVMALLLLAPGVLAADPLPNTGRVLVSTGGDITLPAGEHADAVIVVNGTATILGEANTVVAIDGAANLLGARTGTIIAVRSPIELGPDTIVQGDVMTLDSLVHRTGNADVQGEVKDLASFLIGIGIVLAPALLLWIGFGLATVVAGLLLAGSPPARFARPRRSSAMNPCRPWRPASSA